MAESFLIGQLAARTGRSVHTIRWYEAQGLIPGVMRDGGRRRVYNELHLSWLDLMDRLRRTGMSIAEMREYTALVKQGSATLKQRQALLSSHRAQVRDMIAEWQLALKLLDSKIDFYDEWVTTGKRPLVKVSERAGAALQSLPKEKPRRAVKT
ncbi:MerR family transcriptional regulator [Polaromonas sp. P1-6]|nr:MerR family transcriptional regulator [Polaromonas sp. P1-6]